MADNWQLKAVLSANASGMLSALKSVNTMSRTTRKYLLDVGNSAGNLAGKIGLPLGLISTAMAGLSLAGIKHAVMGFADLTSRISDSSHGVGLTAEEFQRVSYLATQSGIPVDAFSASMGRLNKNIAMAATGKNKDLADLFKKSGIALRGVNGELRAGTELLPEVAALFARNKNAAMQARMGNAIYGKSWQTLAPLLNEGQDGINKLNARYKALGITISNDVVAAGDAFGDQVDDLKQVTSSYGNTITAKLLPALSPLIEQTIKWAVANRGLITTRVSAFITDMANSLAKVDWSGIIKGVGDFVSGIKDFINWVGGARNALIGLVLLMNAPAIMAAIALMGAIGRLSFALGGLALKALAPVAPLQTLTTGMTVANAKAATMVNTMGRLSAAMGVAGAAFAGWQIGGLLNDYVIDPVVRMMTGDKDATLGTGLHSLFNKDPMAEMNKPSLVGAANQVKASGQIQVSFKDAPAGMRVEQTGIGGDIPLFTDVGYRSYATNMP
ncbi:MAG: hypothetical protein Q7U28_07955 [Aquabacterium sp.]|nr:hypothetical protein [Aquabacterium sp.]